MLVEFANDASKRRTTTAGGAVLLMAGFGFLAGAHAVASWSSDPTGRDATMGALVLVSASLASLGGATFALVSAAQSRRHYVFCGRRLLWCAIVLLVSACALGCSLLLSDPFREFAARGKVTSSVLVDMGGLLGAVVCLAGAGVAFMVAWDAFDDERNWGRTMGPWQ